MVSEILDDTIIKGDRESQNTAVYECENLTFPELYRSLFSK